jgi:hypothetical protein
VFLVLCGVKFVEALRFADLHPNHFTRDTPQPHLAKIATMSRVPFHRQNIPCARGVYAFFPPIHANRTRWRRQSWAPGRTRSMTALLYLHTMPESFWFEDVTIAMSFCVVMSPSVRARPVKRCSSRPWLPS